MDISNLINSFLPCLFHPVFNLPLRVECCKIKTSIIRTFVDFWLFSGGFQSVPVQYISKFHNIPLNESNSNFIFSPSYSRYRGSTLLWNYYRKSRKERKVFVFMSISNIDWQRLELIRNNLFAKNWNKKQQIAFSSSLNAHIWLEIQF